MSLEDLSYEHEEQLKSFLKFFRSKRNYQIQEVEACFADQLDVMNEDMYTKDEIRRSMDSLCTAVRSSVLTDLQMTANMSMLVLRQLLEEAEASEIDMDLDMTIIEDQSLLAEASKVAIDAPTRKRRNQKNVKLGGIRDEHQRMMSEFEGVKKQNSELSDLVKDGKRKRKALRKEISSLRDQVDRLRFDNGNGNGNGNGNSNGGSSSSNSGGNGNSNSGSSGNGNGNGNGNNDSGSKVNEGKEIENSDGTIRSEGGGAGRVYSSGGNGNGSENGGNASTFTYDDLMTENQRLRSENSRLATAMIGSGAGSGSSSSGSSGSSGRGGTDGGGSKRNENEGTKTSSSTSGNTPIKSAAQVISGDLQGK